MKKHILFIASLAAMVACSRNEGPAANNPGNVTLIVKDFVDAESGNPFTSDQQTRSTLSIGTSGVDFAFENGDMLGVFPNEANTQQLRIKANVEGDESPVFSGATVGWLLGEGIDYASYYPFKDDYHQIPGNITFSYTGQKQSGNGNESENMTHLGAYDYLYSNVQTPQNNQITFTLSHAGAILHIRHLDAKGGEYESLTISTDAPVIHTSVTMDLFGGTRLTSGGDASSVVIGLDGFTATAGSNLNVWCLLPPADLSGHQLTFTFKGKAGTGTEDTSFIMDGKNMEAGNLYNFMEHVYALKYHSGEGTFEGNVNEYKEMKIADGSRCDFTVIPNDLDHTKPVYPDHELIGWSEIEGGGVDYEAGQIYTILNTAWETSDKVANLYAVYQEIQGQVTVSVEAAEGGTVTIDGEPVSFKNVAPGTQVSLRAIPNLGYKFSKWSDGWLEEGRVETINNNVTYTAEFTKVIVVNVTSSDSFKGDVTGGGYYSPDDDVTIEATPKSGYEFEKWIESTSGDEITDNPYEFTAEADISFTAYFKEASDGSLPGVFSVSATKKVKFSQGNLQYQASTNTWRFAEHQYDVVGGTISGKKFGTVDGSDNGSISSSYSGWIDLFGWGTSGDGTYRNTDDCYHPWDTGTTASKYKIAGLSKNLSIDDKTDWGINSIKFYNNGQWSSGTVRPINGWRTLTNNEWSYLLGLATPNRGNLMFIRCQMTVGGKTILGILILPDDWTVNDWPADNPPQNTDYNATGKSATNFDITSIFEDLQKKGAVFLTQTGYRSGTTYKSQDSYICYYWSSTFGSGTAANYLRYYSAAGISIYSAQLNLGHAVRLVTDVPSE